MPKKITVFTVGFVALVGIGASYAGLLNPRNHEIQKFHPAHTHTTAGETINAPQHSGGTDIYGCHNASVPYHCH